MMRRKRNNRIPLLPNDIYLLMCSMLNRWLISDWSIIYLKISLFWRKLVRPYRLIKYLRLRQRSLNSLWRFFFSLHCSWIVIWYWYLRCLLFMKTLIWAWRSCSSKNFGACFFFHDIDWRFFWNLFIFTMLTRSSGRKLPMLICFLRNFIIWLLFCLI